MKGLVWFGPASALLMVVGACASTSGAERRGSRVRGQHSWPLPFRVPRAVPRVATWGNVPAHLGTFPEFTGDPPSPYDFSPFVDAVPSGWGQLMNETN